MNILIAEDNDIIYEYEKLILTPLGICIRANDGNEAVHLFIESVSSDKKYDLIILDIIMPNIGGYQTLERIRDYESRHNINPHSIIIMASSLDTERNVDKAINMGADGYFVKPLNYNKICEFLINKNIIIE